MTPEVAKEILVTRGRSDWESSVLVAHLCVTGAIEGLPDGATFEDVSVAAELVAAHGPMPGWELRAQIDLARRAREQADADRLKLLCQAIESDSTEWERREIKRQADYLSLLQKQLVRIGIPPEVVLPIAQFLQVAEVRVGASMSVDQVRAAIHSAARRIASHTTT